MNGLLRALSAAALCAALVAPAHAEDSGAMAKYRQNTMKSMGAHMAALAAILKGDVSLKAHAAGHAAALADAAAMVPELFPKGSDAGDTEALPAIWQKPAEFSKAADAVRAGGTKLGAAAKSQSLDALKAAQAELGSACKGCHDNFRKKK